MKKKFGLGLSQLIAPSRSDERQSDATMYQQEGSPPPSPYPGRRAPLPSRIEAELRVACVGVVTNQRPSHMPVVTEDASSKAHQKAQLDYAAIKKTIDKPVDVAIPASKRRSTHTMDPDPAELADARAGRRYSYRPESTSADLFTARNGTNEPTPIAAANAMRMDPSHGRNKSASLSQTIPTRLYNDRPKASQRSASHETSGSTPHTDITEYPWSTSTAPTSAGVTPARASKRASAHLNMDQDASVRTGSTPMDWIRGEVDKRRNHAAAPRSRRPSEYERPDVQPAARAPSRARSIRSMKSIKSIKSITGSIKDNIKDYIRTGSSRNHSRPGTRSGSHAHTKSSSEHDRHERGPAVRPPPRRDWRNWGRSNKEDSNNNNNISSADVSGSSSIRGRSESRKGTSVKSEINLNRELPPLPSLDQWKEQEQGREKPLHIVKMKSVSTHSKPSLAADRVGQMNAKLSNSSTVNERDEIVAARLGSPVRSKPEVYQPTRPLTQPRVNPNHSQSIASGVARTTDTDREARDGAVRIEFGIEDLIPSYANNTAAPPAHAHSRSGPFEKKLDATSRLRATPPAGHSRSGSSVSRTLSLGQSHSQTSPDPSRSGQSLPTTAHGFSKHRKYDISDIPPALNSNYANEGRKVASKQESSDSRYRRTAEVQSKPATPAAAQSKDDKKGWWHLKSKQKKPATWMDQLEKLGIKDGVLLHGEMAGSPVVRY